MNNYRVTVKNGSTTVFSEVISAEDERDALGTLLVRSELFGESFTEVRIVEV